jgi:hypothetical protein
MSTKHETLKEALQLIREERERQVLEEGYTGHHDAVNGHENLVMAAATYEMEPKDRKEHPESWPWNYIHWKPTAHKGTTGRVRELVKAGALYMAAKAVMEAKGLEIPLKQAVCEKIDLMAEMIAELLVVSLNEESNSLTTLNTIP